jgi:hypothetical protein
MQNYTICRISLAAHTNTPTHKYTRFKATSR